MGATKRVVSLQWTPIKQYPLTIHLNNHFSGNPRTRLIKKPEIISEDLCDQALERIAPFLLRNTPVDVLDLWPGVGIISSKINALIRPRRHVLVEPALDVFQPLLETLVQSDPSYKLVSSDDLSRNKWESLLHEHFPDQGPGNCDATGLLPRNDTLLVLANPPTSGDSDHFTPSRWWSSFMEACMRQAGLHLYGSVRLLATVPTAEASTILPRQVSERRRPALWTENVALHAFEVAAPQEDHVWANMKTYGLAMDNAARVAERTAEKNVPIPPGREPTPLIAAPESPDPGKIKIPYTPRIRTTLQERLFATIQATADISPSVPGFKDLYRQRGRALTRLNMDNRQAHALLQKANKCYELDQKYRSLSRAAADPNADLASLKPILDKITALKKDLDKPEEHPDHFKSLPLVRDNFRVSLDRNKFDESLLLWDRRPFEPLTIEWREFYPRRASPRTLIYFEADPNPPFAPKLAKLHPSKRSEAYRIYESLISSLNRGRDSISAAEVLDLLFPSRSANDIVKTIPSLAEHAAKAPKPDFDSLPKTVHGESLDGGPPDPALSYQENLDYDLNDVRIRCLSSSTMWDICIEYMKSGASLTALQLSRLLGGTLTMSQISGRQEPKKRLH
ncbi:S-adenosyl-L-methionine-dependent methyltransferase [Aspergillus heteromorphus CBS 117.55]|uniref:S-adenosyl-L-methionine-dependent methyltransferase n=1 Tax=Aspergillus heteromorphus CBS 117.55 TaxID=1448321 RepID=A0A317X5H0_9EURO|nr:S-adenosyl-L-methionine-dependent methyltransferase [Aspergillus heteromorphus CBS 117.55]PWY92787.1 S-adenosyl-L-methionine-dependent methyltransferase [Aspergillus heteromorphus CBS 117.55]